MCILSVHWEYLQFTTLFSKANNNDDNVGQPVGTGTLLARPLALLPRLRLFISAKPFFVHTNNSLIKSFSWVKWKTFLQSFLSSSQKEKKLVPMAMFRNMLFNHCKMESITKGKNYYKSNQSHVKCISFSCAQCKKPDWQVEISRWQSLRRWDWEWSSPISEIGNLPSQIKCLLW